MLLNYTLKNDKNDNYFTTALQTKKYDYTVPSPLLNKPRERNLGVCQRQQID